MPISKYAMVFLAAICVASAQQAAPPASMHSIFLEDQSDREAPGGDMSKLDWAKMTSRDAVRQKLVRAMLEAGELKTGKDYREASFIFQHGFKEEDFLLAHILATVALAKGDAESRWISAATLDRYLQRTGKPQVFGTQYNRKNQDPMTQDPFNKALIPEKLREALCVPNDHLQQVMLEAFQHDREPDFANFKSEQPCR